MNVIISFSICFLFPEICLKAVLHYCDFTQSWKNNNIVSPEYQITTRISQMYWHSLLPWLFTRNCLQPHFNPAAGSGGQTDSWEGIPSELTASWQGQLIMTVFLFWTCLNNYSLSAQRGRLCHWGCIPSERTEKEGTLSQENIDIP